MLEAGEDPRFVARRLMIISASEDVGMADPTALPLAVAAAQAVQLIGMPEAPDRARPGRGAPRAGPEVERLLPRDRGGRGRRPRRAGRPRTGAPARRPLPGRGPARATARATVYAHDDPRGVVEQQYAPDAVAGRTYYARPTGGVRARARPTAGTGPARLLRGRPQD